MFAIVDLENKDSCSWFFGQIRDAMVVMERDIIIIFDKKKGVMEAMPLVLLNVHYSFCLRHLAKNLHGETKDNMARK